MSAGLHLRAATPGDADALSSVFRAAVLEGAAADYTAEERQAWVRRCPDPAGWAARIAGGPVFLALRADQPAGLASLAGARFDLLYVHPAHGRAGVATALHRRIVEEARARGLAQLTVAASDSALQFFAAQGWHILQRNAVDCGGVWLQNTIMMRTIAGETAE